MKALLDSSILIDHLNGIAAATEALNTYDVHITASTMNEILQGADSTDEYNVLLELLKCFTVLNADLDTYQTAFKLQLEKNLSLKNALTYATAKQAELMLVTSDARAFSNEWLDVKIPYENAGSGIAV